MTGRILARVDENDDDWPGRVGVLGLGVDRGRPYLVVEFPDGEGGEYPPDALTAWREVPA